MNIIKVVIKTIVVFSLCSSMVLAANNLLAINTVLTASNALTAQQTVATQTLISTYQDNDLTFDAVRGKTLWQQTFVTEKGERSCSSCHTNQPSATGEHITTGKLIEPMSPYTNLKRLSDIRKIKKWFVRNCKWTVGRLCTDQEKGDLLYFLTQQKGI